MNLAFDSWIPVVAADGSRARISLSESLTAGDRYLDFDVRPHERIALMRLHICIAQAALDGPVSAHDLQEVTKQLPHAATKYLEKWRDRFELFHADTPFLQRADVLQLPGADATSTTKLIFSLATGANSTLYDHGAITHDQREIATQDLAVALVTFQNFSPGGLIAQLSWNGEKTNKSSKHAPCTPSSMLHVFVRRDHVLATISANLLTKGQVERTFGKQGWGTPLWEMIPVNEQDPAVKNATHSYLGRLVPMPRFIRLLSNTEMLLGNGFNYPSFDEVMAEPSATVVVNHDGSERFLLGAKLDRALWRQLHALGKFRQNDSPTGGAVSLQNLRQSDPCDIWVGALLTNKATIIDTVESAFSLPRNFRLDESLNRYSTQVSYVEFIGRQLSRAVETYRQNIDGAWESRLKLAGPKKNEVRRRLCSAALRDYWTAIEVHRDKLVQFALADPEGDGTMEKEWRAAVRSFGRSSYRAACMPRTARERRAFALGLKKLFAHVNAVAEEPGAEDDSDDNDDKE